MKARPHQRGRAELQFLGTLATVASAAGRAVVAEAEALEAARPATGGSGEARLAEATWLAGRLERRSPYGWWSYLNRYGSLLQAHVATEAFADMADDVVDALDGGDPAWGDVEVATDFAPPDGYLGYPFHLTTGGWDGHPHMGFIHRELIYPFVFEHAFRRRPGGGDLRAQKRRVAEMAGGGGYRRILDLGTGTGSFLEALGDVYPTAELYGVDLSPTLLRYAHHRAGDAGQRWHLRAAPCDGTGFADAMFDLVTVFVLFHEVPLRVIETTLAEARRVLAPGGDLLIADAVPYRHLDPVRVMVSDWETENRNEPFWRGHGLADLPAMLAAAGFESIEERPAGPAPYLYPWVTTAQAPAARVAEVEAGEEQPVGVSA